MSADAAEGVSDAHYHLLPADVAADCRGLPLRWALSLTHCRRHHSYDG